VPRVTYVRIENGQPIFPMNRPNENGDQFGDIVLAPGATVRTSDGAIITNSQETSVTLRELTQPESRPQPAQPTMAIGGTDVPMRFATSAVIPGLSVLGRSAGPVGELIGRFVEEGVREDDMVSVTVPDSSWEAIEELPDEPPEDHGAVDLLMSDDW